jgi:transcriptional regulator with XRE-family HTH domain
MTDMTLAQRIKLMRKAKQLSQGALATQLGVAQGTVSGWENGSEPNGESIPPLAEFLGLGQDEVRRLAVLGPDGGRPGPREVIDRSEIDILDLVAAMERYEAAIQRLNDRVERYDADKTAMAIEIQALRDELAEAASFMQAIRDTMPGRRLHVAAQGADESDPTVVSGHTVIGQAIVEGEEKHPRQIGPDR